MFGFGKKAHYLNYPNLNLKRRTDVVGESFYQHNLAQAARITVPADQSLWVALRAEPNNPHDHNAIRVDWVKPDGSGWLTVGYIAREETTAWHQLLSTVPKGVVWCWPAELMGGDDGRSWGIYFRG